MAGLDPAIHVSSAVQCRVDARVKPAHEEWGNRGHACLDCPTCPHERPPYIRIARTVEVNLDVAALTPSYVFCLTRH